MSIKVWDEIPVKEHNRGLQLLIISEKGREGLPFSLTLFVNSSDNFAYIIYNLLFILYLLFII